MRWVVLTGLFVLVLSGCAAGHGVTVYSPAPGRAAANLALGPTRDHNRLAEVFTHRSSWPSVGSGYYFDDLSTYTEVIYDDQSFFDPRDGGGYMREAVSVRTGVIAR